ncbi:MAG TPA: hypothetical protein VE262_01470 [Blastocatellia bacterium]|nr:hypothetical protein [Blastocatellia bacterium]
MRCPLLPRSVCSIIVAISLSQLCFIQAAQQPQGEVRKHACDQEGALFLALQQVEEVSGLDPSISSISIRVRIAELIWPSREENARAILTDAYDSASRYFQDKADATSVEDRLQVLFEDPRFTVIRAVARYDPKWARKLTEAALEEMERMIEAKGSGRQPIRDAGEKLLHVAHSLLPINQGLALEMARRSLQYSIDPQLINFLYRLSEVDQEAADQFYREALRVGAGKSLEALLSLSPYPFALDRSVGSPANVYIHSVPKNLVTSAELQGLFLDQLLARAVKVIGPPGEASGNEEKTFSHLGDPAQIYLAITGVEPAVARAFPSRLKSFQDAKQLLRNRMTGEDFKDVSANLERSREAGGGSFESALKEFERTPEGGEKDLNLLNALDAARDGQSLDQVLGHIRKMSDESLRDQMLDRFYFKRAQVAIKDGLPDEAKQFADKVRKADYRAYLYYETAAETLKRINDKARAGEMLEGILSIAEKAPDTNEKARILLSVVYLYSKFDHLRAFEVLNTTIKTINRVGNPVINRGYFTQTIRGRNFSTYRSTRMEGYSLESALGGLAPQDFERALFAARTLENKGLRASAIIALISPCLKPSGEK